MDLESSSRLLVRSFYIQPGLSVTNFFFTSVYIILHLVNGFAELLIAFVFIGHGLVTLFLKA